MPDIKKQKSVRDDIEQAVRTSLPVVAGMGGAMLGGKFFRSMTHMRNPKVIMREIKKAEQAGNKSLAKRLNQEYVDTTSYLGTPYVIGGITGANAGYGAGSLYLQGLDIEAKKRRK